MNNILYFITRDRADMVKKIINENKSLLDYISDDEQGNTLLHLCSKYHALNVAKFIVNNNPKLLFVKNKIGLLPVDIAVKCKIINFLEEIMNKQIKKGAKE